MAPSPLSVALRDAFAVLPPDKRGALIVIADEQGARVTVAARIGSGQRWKLAASASQPWDGPVSGVVSVQGSW